MAGICVTVDTSRMLDSAAFARVYKGVEYLYYALLYSTDPAYRDSGKEWTAWVEMGFNKAIRDAPPETRDQDRLAVTVRSVFKTFEVRVSSSNEQVLEKLQGLIQDIESLRPSVQGLDQANKAKELLSSKVISGKLLEPMASSFQRHKLPQADADALLKTIERTLLAFCYRDISSVTVAPAKATARA